MRIAYVNLIDDATLTPVSEDLIYPVENVQNQRLAKPWRTTSLTGVSVVADLGGTASVMMAAILGHNLTTSATLTISGNTTSSFVAPSYTTSMTSVDGIILKYFGAAQELRYWQYTIEDPTNTAAYVEVGRLWLGVFLQVEPTSTVDFSVNKRRSDTVTYGRGRQKYATEGVGWRAFDLSFDYVAGTALTAVQTLVDTVGLHSSFIFSNFDSSLDYDIVLPCYVSIADELGFRHKQHMAFGYTLKLEEDR